MAANLVAENNTDLCSYSSGDQEPKMGFTSQNQRVGTAAFPLDFLGKNLFPYLS